MSIQSSGGVFTANVTRSFTRLKSVFATFLSHSKLAADTGSLTIKDWNYFYHPMASYAPGARYSPNDEMELQIQVGSMLMPEYPVKTTRGIHTAPEMSRHPQLNLA